MTSDFPSRGGERLREREVFLKERQHKQHEMLEHIPYACCLGSTFVIKTSCVEAKFYVLCMKYAILLIDQQFPMSNPDFISTCRDRAWGWGEGSPYSAAATTYGHSGAFPLTCSIVLVFERVWEAHNLVCRPSHCLKSP